MRQNTSIVQHSILNPIITAHLKPSIQYNLTFGLCMKYGQEVGSYYYNNKILSSRIKLQSLTNTIWMIV